MNLIFILVGVIVFLSFLYPYRYPLIGLLISIVGVTILFIISILTFNISYFKGNV